MRSSRLPCPEGVLSFCCRPIDTEPRVQSPLERWPSMVSMDRPEMGSRPCEVLLQLGHVRLFVCDPMNRSTPGLPVATEEPLKS